MLRVGLTGGIATGKSTVGQMFVDLGCHLIDSDTIAHQLYEPGQPIYDAVVQAFGPRIVAPNGTIDRKILGEIVFNDPQSRAKLNSLLHPAIIQRQQEWLREIEGKIPDGIGIVGATLMIEAGNYRNFDKLIVVSCSTEEQKRRLRQRSHLSEEQIEARLRSQMPTDEKVKYADYVIDSSGDLARTSNQVAEVNSRLREFAASTSGRRRS
ncbi:MAG TPA: dephospho-CoA kinase [Terriglobia bacterium]|nr:dephospho-CoA kinase [Terriglobia bacterium]